MAKAYSALQEMNLRGLHQNNVGRYTATKIFKSIITPILTYGLEAFPMTAGNYNALDNFMGVQITKNYHNLTLTKLDTIPITKSWWQMREQHITPPSLIIQRNKISLYIKSKGREHSLPQHLLKSFPTNFLTLEIQDLENKHHFNLQEISDKYKGEKIVPKAAIKLILASMEDKLDQNMFDCLNWLGELPNQLPLTCNKPHPDLMDLRATLIFNQTGNCGLCDKLYSNKYEHLMFDCSHSYPELNRTQIQVLKVLAGLALTQDEETNQFLLHVAVQCICTLKGMS